MQHARTQECGDLVNVDSMKELVEGYLEAKGEGVMKTKHHNMPRDTNSFNFKITLNFRKSLGCYMRNSKFFLTVQLDPLVGHRR